MATPFRSRILGVLVASLAVAGCSGTDGEAPPSTTERIAAVRQARDSLGAPAAELASEVAATTAAIERLREQPPAEPARRLAAAVEVRGQQLSRLTSALARAEAVEVEAATPDVAAAGRAFDDAVTAAGEVRGAALRDLAGIEAAARLDADLDEVVAGWDSSGSRRQQMDAFAALAEAAERVEGRARRLEEVAECLTTFSRRADAAAVVAERTGELRELIVAHRGASFDDLRDGYRQDPFGDARRPVEADAAELACWRREAALPAAAEAFEAAVAALEAALNPQDLSG